MVGRAARNVLKHGAPVRFTFGLRRIKGRVVEAIVPRRASQPIVYRVAFHESDADPMEVVLRDTDLTVVQRQSPSRRRRVSG